MLYQDEILLEGGKWVVNKGNDRSDLTAVDKDGNLVLIEIKEMLRLLNKDEAFEFKQ